MTPQPLSMPGEAGVSEWKPITTAPKDGTVIRLRCESYEPAEPFWWEKGRWSTKVYSLARYLDGWWDKAAEQPTHWQPLASRQGADQ